MRRTGRRALHRPSKGSELGALFIADGDFVSVAIAAMEPSFGAVCGASFFICSRLARTSSSVTLTFAASRGASAGFWAAGAAIAWRKSLLDMLVLRAPLRALLAALLCAEVTRAAGCAVRLQLLAVIYDEQC